ncbi:hypothetical protein PPE_06520 [Paenibacillus polymyxa E681]|nr:hypothetical protein PPE_06520 [Paenibacillus polymyxa E681]
MKSKGGSSYGLLVPPTYHALAESFAAFKASRLQGIYTQADSATDTGMDVHPFFNLAVHLQVFAHLGLGEGSYFWGFSVHRRSAS